MSDSNQWTILRTLEWIQGYFADKGLETPRLDAEVIMAHVLSTQRVMLYARFDQPLHPPELAAIKGLVARRARREPVAYLVGKKEFWSLDLAVDSGCLIPRPDSETVVEIALGLNRQGPTQTVVDVGTGSGCLALALAKELPDATVYALENADGARKIACKNAEQTGLIERVSVLSSDLLSGLPCDTKPIDLLVANLPYIPTGDLDSLMPDVRYFEPQVALDGGPDGLDLYRRLLNELDGRLALEAGVVFEAGSDQLAALGTLMTEHGLKDIEVHRDGTGRDRVVVGRI